MKQIEYLRENIQKDDIIVYSNIGNGGVIAAFFPENKQYFYNGAHWDVEKHINHMDQEWKQYIVMKTY